MITSASIEMLDEQVTDNPIVEKDYVVKGFTTINYIF